MEVSVSCVSRKEFNRVCEFLSSEGWEMRRSSFGSRIFTKNNMWRHILMDC